MAKRKFEGWPDKSHVISFRVTDETLGELDEYVAALRAREPGASWTRSSAAANLAVKALQDWREAQNTPRVGERPTTRKK